MAKADPSKNDSQVEMETAMKLAQKIAMQYNLDLSQLGEETKVSKMLQQEINRGDLFPKNEGQWLVKLLFMLARHNFCRGWTISDGKVVGFNLVGEEHNVQIVMFFFEQLSARIRRLARESWGNYSGPETKNTYLRGFYLGCVAGIDHQLDEQERAQVREQPEINALILRKDAAVVEFVQSLGLKFSPHKGPRSSGTGGIKSGFEAGKSMSLHKGLGSRNAGGQNLIG